MRHQFSVEGFGIRLRPVVESDADAIVRLRRLPHAVDFLGVTDPDSEKQREWIRAYEARENDYYFAIERLGATMIGAVGIYDVDPERRAAEWGRWILEPGYPAAAASALLVYDVGFDALGLDLIYCVTLHSNKRVLSFHDRLGLPRARTIQRRIAERTDNFVVHELRRDVWIPVRKALTKAAEDALAFLPPSSG